MNAPPNERVTLPLDRAQTTRSDRVLPGSGVLWALVEVDKDIASQEICGFVERD